MSVGLSRKGRGSKFETHNDNAKQEPATTLCDA